MIPNAARGVSHIAARIAKDLVAKAPDAYFAADLAYITGLLSMIGQDYNRAAEVFTSEHALICEILGEAEPHIASGELRTRIAGARALETPSLRIPDLAARADREMKVLIDVHAAVEAAEENQEAWARPMNKKIWCFLERFVANRAYEVAL